MNKPIVRCRCGHQVLSKEVLRTDLYERRAPGDASRDYVYVKYRCRHCKRMGETFVAESRWDWAMLEAEPNEMTDQERDRFLDEEIVTAEDILDFHRDLETFTISDLSAMTNDDIAIPTAEIAIPESEPKTDVASDEVSNVNTTKGAATEEEKPVAQEVEPTPPEMRPTLKVEKAENSKAETLSRAPHPPDEPRNEPQNDARRKRP